MILIFIHILLSKLLLLFHLLMFQMFEQHFKSFLEQLTKIIKIKKTSMRLIDTLNQILNLAITEIMIIFV